MRTAWDFFCLSKCICRYIILYICLLCVYADFIIASEGQEFDLKNAVYFPDSVWKCTLVDV